MYRGGDTDTKKQNARMGHDESKKKKRYKKLKTRISAILMSTIIGMSGGLTNSEVYSQCKTQHGYNSASLFNNDNETDYNQCLEESHQIESWFGGKKYEGYFGIDISCKIDLKKDKNGNPIKDSYGKYVYIKDENGNYVTGATPTNIRKIFTSDNNYTQDNLFSNGNQLKKPDYLICRIGATGTSKKQFSFATEPEAYYEVVSNVARECEKLGVPYGFYYYSQATTKEEAELEIKYIADFYRMLGNCKYNVIPFYLDIEHCDNSRVEDFVKKNGKDKYTDVVNYEMNRLREELSNYGVKKVGLYTYADTFDKEINYNQLDSKNQKNLWLVDVNFIHGLKLLLLHNETLKNAVIKQTHNDVIIKDADGDMIVDADCDFIDSGVFSEWTKELKGSSCLKSSDSVDFWPDISIENSDNQIVNDTITYEKATEQTMTDIADEKIFGIYPGSIKDIDAVKKYSASELREQIFRISNKIKDELNEDNISIQDILEDQYALEYLMQQTRQFGVLLPVPEKGKHIKATDSFNNWYVQNVTAFNYLVFVNCTANHKKNNQRIKQKVLK